MDIVLDKKYSESIVQVAKDESLNPGIVESEFNKGTIVIPQNVNRSLKKINGVGRGLKTKVNANIGTSPYSASLEKEKEKLDACIKAGADAVMDLSTGGDLREIRKMVLDNCPVCVGTVPIYQTACETASSGKGIASMDAEHMFNVIEEQAEEGVDFMTVHCGINKRTVEILNKSDRLVGVVSRGGAMLVNWIMANNKENPLYEDYDKLLKIAKKYGVTLSLGDGLRPGCLNDACDSAQIGELKILGELVLRAREAGVQVMVEGPGHMPLNIIQKHIIEAKRIIHDAPFYLLGPLVTDIAAGYDHITSAIGGAIAAAAGADFLCYVTPAEHLRLPDKNDVYEGVIASRIAGHAADIVKGVPGAKELDNEFSKYRKALDWKNQEKLALDPIKFKKEREKLLPDDNSDVCTMCGQFCAMKK